MQHLGDLQPLRQPDFLADHAPLGRYSAKRSRWRFAVGSLEVGFDRASEELEAETLRPAPAAAPSPDFGHRLLILMGTVTTTLLVVALAGWLWSSRGSLIGSETVSASIIDRGDVVPSASLAVTPPPPLVIPTPGVKPARLTAVIEQGKPAPAVAPAPRAAVAIAEGRAIEPKPAADAGKTTPAPDEAIVASGNYLLIPGVARAVSLAMTNGEAQNWAAGSYHGIVVMGDAAPKDGKTCRQGTVLLRDGSAQGRTQTFERCL
jgi:hypothetical protein